jgi:hypothetical protein
MVGENPKKNQPEFFVVVERDHPLRMASIRSY